MRTAALAAADHSDSFADSVDTVHIAVVVEAEDLGAHHTVCHPFGNNYLLLQP